MAKLKFRINRIKALRILDFVSHFIVGTLLIILLGKLWVGVVNGSDIFIYGVLVSLIIIFNFIVAIYFYKDPYLAASKNKKLPAEPHFVSILVPVMNEKEIIAQCINSLIAQKYRKKEIIIINDASTDGTTKILKKYQEQGLIKLINLRKNIGKKRALAKGMLVARGDIFAFTDSDTVLESDSIAKLVKVFAHHPDIGAVSGHCRALNGQKNLLTKVQDSWYEGQFSIRKAFESTFGAVTCVSGPLAVFRKEAIFNFIPAWENDTFLGQEFKFATDRTLTAFVLGQTTIGAKLKKKYARSPFVKSADYPLKDWKIVYSKSAKAFTVVPESMKSFVKQQIRWKKSFIRNIFFTGKFFWKKPFIPAFSYYAHILFVLVGPFIAFRHLVYLPLTGNFFSALAYIVGIAYVGFMFGLAYKLENPDSNRWMYRPIMSIISTLVLSWFIFYSMVTIKRSVWARG